LTAVDRTFYPSDRTFGLVVLAVAARHPLVSDPPPTGSPPRMPAIDWDGAAVSSGTLVVGLSETPTRPWGLRFRSVCAILGVSAGDWEDIVLRGRTIRVSGVREGAEERLRHLLDSAVLEAGGGERPQPARDEQRERDRRMTAAFRAPAGPA
jgi:hypothetical protein